MDELTSTHVEFLFCCLYDAEIVQGHVDNVWTYIYIWLIFQIDIKSIGIWTLLTYIYIPSFLILKIYPPIHSSTAPFLLIHIDSRLTLGVLTHFSLIWGEATLATLGSDPGHFGGSGASSSGSWWGPKAEVRPPKKLPRDGRGMVGESLEHHQEHPITTIWGKKNLAKNSNWGVGLVITSCVREMASLGSLHWKVSWFWRIYNPP